MCSALHLSGLQYLSKLSQSPHNTERRWVSLSLCQAHPKRQSRMGGWCRYHPDTHSRCCLRCCKDTDASVTICFCVIIGSILCQGRMPIACLSTENSLKTSLFTWYYTLRSHFLYFTDANAVETVTLVCPVYICVTSPRSCLMRLVDWYQTYSPSQVNANIPGAHVWSCFAMQQKICSLSKAAQAVTCCIAILEG